MKVEYQAASGEEDVYVDSHDAIHGVPRLGESVQAGGRKYHVVDVIWRPQVDTVHVVLKKRSLT